MAKTNHRSGGETAVIVVFFILVSLSLLSPLWVFKDLLFPFITSKAFSFRIFVELAFPLYVYLLIIRKEYRPSLRNPLTLCMLAFVALSSIASFTGVNTIRSVWGNFERMGGAYYLLHLVLLALYIVLLAQLGGKYIKWILYVAFAVAAFITLNGLSGWLGGPIVVTDPSLPARVSSTLGNPIFLGSYLILPMFLSAFFALQAESLGKKITFWALASLMLAGIFLSVTRGAIVGLIAGVIFAAAVYVILQTNQKIRMYGTVVILFGIVLLGSLFIFHKKLPDNRLTRLFTLEDSNSQARLIEWKAALRGVKDYPLLGVGPENFYVVSNKYYDPQIVKYDPSWFDKPHNYVLEVLVTTGALGFIAYAGMSLLVLWALWRSYRSGFLSLLQMSMLVAGFASYFVQNLFVFDTIAASMMFYVFVGFSIYLLDEVAALEKPVQKGSSVGSQGFAVAAGLLSAVVVIYAVYVTNIVPAYASASINYGYAYATVDPAKSVGYFQDAVNSSFNFDPQDTAQRYSESITNIVQGVQSSQVPTIDQQTLEQYINQAIAYEKQTAGLIKNDPISWQKLATNYYILAVVAKTDLNPEALLDAQRAVDLAPDRYEPSLFQAQMDLIQNNLPGAATVLQGMTQKFPLIGYTSSSWWLLGSVDHQAGKDQEGLPVVSQVINKNFPPQTPGDLAWVLTYYDSQKNYAAELALYQEAVQWFPGDANTYFGLVQAYAKAGQVQVAKDMANQLLQSASTTDANKQVIQQFLKSLK